MTDREIMQQALEALKASHATHPMWKTPIREAIDALRDRLARPEQEPVAYINVEARRLEWAKPTRWGTPTVAQMDRVPLYTTPPRREWVGLTDEEVGTLTVFPGLFDVETPLLAEFVRAIEAALKEKNNG